MAGYLGQLAGLAAGHGERTTFYNGHPVPVICAGDIFDRWNAPAELINFALAYLRGRTPWDSGISPPELVEAV